jgi:signal transduction histidine kinase
MGSLLQPKEELDKLLQDAMEKNILFVVGNGRDRSIHGLLDNLYNRFKQIVAEHDTFEDLGIKNLAEQMSKGARLLEILELKYHVVVANPPYLSQSKVDGELLKLFKNNSSELYESFIYTFQTKLTPSGFMGFLVSHNFMFISKFEALRKSLLDNGNIYKLAQLGTATFEDVSNTNALGFAMFVWQEGNSSNTGTYLRIGTGNYLKDQNKDKAKLLQEQYRKFVVPKSSFSEIPGYPLIYWWTEEFRETYKNAKKISEIALIKQGLISGDINRYLRSVWEVSLSDISLFKDETKKFFPYLKGADGRRWFDDAKDIIQYSNNGREFDLNNSSRHQNSDSYFIQSIAFSKIGTSDFLGRLQRYKSIFSEAASSIFIDNPEETLISLSSSIPAFVSTSLNPTINTTNSDVQKLPIFPVPHWEDYFHRAKSLYDHYFSLKETCIEYCYTGDTAGKDASSYSIFAPELAEFHHFEFLHQAKELELRSEIDKVVYEQFSEETQNAIKEEVRESVGMYPEWDQEELERFIYDNNWKVIRDAHLEVNTDHPKGPIIFNEKVVEKIIHSINQYASETVNFSIDAALIDRLGEELVGKSETAVSELIKNAYDADATKVEVYFSDLDDPSRSMLRILDNGEGMSRETLVNGFLRIASPNKVYNPNSPKFNRKRAGKKGIGRFATQRLGQNLLIRTQRAEENNGWELSINWNDFTRGKELTQIASLLRSVPKLSSSGTELVIERLKDEWDERTIKRILNSIASILHPKLRIVHDDQKEDVFFVKFFVFKDGELTSLEDEIQEDFLKYSTAVFEGGIDKNNQGYVKISTTLKSNTMLPIFDDVISFPYQKETLVDKSTEKVKSNDNATVETDETDDTNPSNEIIKDNRNLSKQSSNFEIKSKVYFKAYYFIIEEDVKANRLIRKALSEYTRSNGGIKLYRNGFKVSPYGSEGNDWLQLDERASRRLVKAPFSNRNFVGYVEIENDIANEFNETSSREGLIENEVFEQLRYLLKESLKLAVLRVKSAREQLNPKKEVEDIYKRIREIKTHLRGEKPSIDLVYLRNSFSELEIILKAKNKLLLEELDYRRILASMGLLIGYYVHDIKQYVHTMISQIRALKNMYKDDIFSSFEKNLTIFDNYTAYFDSTISQNVRRELKPIDLRTVVMEFKQTIQYDLDKFNLEVEYDFQGIKLITCAMHPSEWSSILFNFYTNARKAIYAARRPKGKILIRCGKSEGRVYLEFHDNGNGIPEEKRQWIFREGYTTSKAVEYGKKDPMAGSGLGLKIVHEIIDSYDGTIAAIDSNEEGYITCLKIELPEATKEERLKHGM